MTHGTRVFVALGLALALGASPVAAHPNPFAHMEARSYVKGKIWGLAEPAREPASGNPVFRILQVDGWPTLDHLRQLASGQWQRIDFETPYDPIEGQNLLANMKIAGIPWEACDDLDDCWSEAEHNRKSLPKDCLKCVPPGTSCSGVKHISKSPGGGCTATCDCDNNATPIIEYVCSRPIK